MKKVDKSGRTTVYNKIVDQETLNNVCDENKYLENEFLDYLRDTDHSEGTIKQYKYILHLFWVWNYKNNKDTPFNKIGKRAFLKFQGYGLNECGWSPNRVRTVKAVLSSLSNFIENILDEEDEYEGFTSVVKKVENPVKVTVREKLVLSEEQLEDLLKRLVKEGEYMAACVLSLAMNSGRRKAEILRFKVSYFDDCNLICDGALYKTPEKVTTKGRGSKGKQLELYTLAKKFKPYLDLWLAERERLGIDSDWLFPKKKNGVYLDEVMDVGVVDRLAINLFSPMLGVQFYMHSLRHYFTTELQRANIPDSVIQSIVGWESADMVNVYSDLSKESQFEKYFGAEGIKAVRQGSLTEL